MAKKKDKPTTINASALAALGSRAYGKNKGNMQMKGPVSFPRKSKPKASQIGKGKGDYRKVGNYWKRRRFTVAQRRKFRSRRDTGRGTASGF